MAVLKIVQRLDWRGLFGAPQYLFTNLLTDMHTLVRLKLSTFYLEVLHKMEYFSHLAIEA